MVVACTRSPGGDGAPVMTTPIAGGKITREAMLAAALEIIGLVHAGVDGEDADQAGQVEETPHRPAAGRGRCWPPPRPVARRTPRQTTTRPSRECAWLNATLSRVPARGTSTSSTNPGPNQPSTIRGQCCGAPPTPPATCGLSSAAHKPCPGDSAGSSPQGSRRTDRPGYDASSGDTLAQGCHHSPFGVTVPFAHGLEGADRSAVDVSAKIMPTL